MLDLKDERLAMQNVMMIRTFSPCCTEEAFCMHSWGRNYSDFVLVCENPPPLSGNQGLVDV